MFRITLVWYLLVSSTALAQSPPPAAPPAPAPSAPTPPVEPPAAEIEAAKVHFDQAVALYNDGNMSAALAEFEAAYKLRPEVAIVLKNIGLTQKALFRYSEAIASLERYLIEAVNLAPESRAEVVQIIGEMKALLADVALAITPAGAAIHVDGRPAGTSPLSKALAIAAGSHNIEISAEGYHSQTKDVIVTAGVGLALKFDLVAIPKTGRVRIYASVPRATVSIDGRALGLAPVDAELGPGGHTLQISAQDYKVHREELSIAVGQTRDVRVLLDKIVVAKDKSWYQKWYVWTAIGALAVTGGVTAYGLSGGFSSTQDPLEGSLGIGSFE